MAVGFRGRGAVILVLGMVLVFVLLICLLDWFSGFCCIGFSGRVCYVFLSTNLFRVFFFGIYEGGSRGENAVCGFALGVV